MFVFHREMIKGGRNKRNGKSNWLFGGGLDNIASVLVSDVSCNAQDATSVVFFSTFISYFGFQCWYC